MILIADSGSTKTDWVLLNLKSGEKKTYSGIGLNPYYSDSNSVLKEVSTLFKNLDTSRVSHLYFYGAGCSSIKTKKIITEGLQPFFSSSNIEVSHDLDGAARALCKTTNGIACILGTGSNAAVYDGQKITKTAVSLGYLLGDEGSGNALGKKLIHSIFLQQAPQEIISLFNNEFSLSLDDLLSEIYHKPSPNRYLASFSTFINRNKHHSFLLDLIYKTFEEFLEIVIKPLQVNQNLPLHFTGSIAWFFQSELKHIVEKAGYTTGIISQKPIDELVIYHQATEY